MMAHTRHGGALLAAATLFVLSCTTERLVGVLIDNPGPSLDAGATFDARGDFPTVHDDTGTPTAGADAPAIAPTTDATVEIPRPAMYFARIPAGQPLPDEATCAAKVRRSAREQRPDNAPFNTWCRPRRSLAS